RVGSKSLRRPRPHRGRQARGRTSLARAVRRSRAAGEPFGAVLMDVRMPETDGIEATRRIRAAEAARSGPRTPIIGLSAGALEEDRGRLRPSLGPSASTQLRLTSPREAQSLIKATVLRDAKDRRCHVGIMVLQLRMTAHESYWALPRATPAPAVRLILWLRGA